MQHEKPLATHFEDFLGEPLSGPGQLDALERRLRAQLVQMNEDHRLRTQPLINELVRIQYLKPLPALMVTVLGRPDLCGVTDFTPPVVMESGDTLEMAPDGRWTHNGRPVDVKTSYPNG